MFAGVTAAAYSGCNWVSAPWTISASALVSTPSSPVYLFLSVLHTGVPDHVGDHTDLVQLYEPLVVRCLRVQICAAVPTAPLVLERRPLVRSYFLRIDCGMSSGLVASSLILWFMSTAGSWGLASSSVAIGVVCSVGVLPYSSLIVF